MSHSPGRALLILTCTSLLCVATVAFADDAQPPKPSDATAGMLEAMREKGILTEEQLARALADQTANGGRLGERLVELGYVSSTALARVLAEQYGPGAARWYDRLAATIPEPFLATVSAAALGSAAAEIMYLCRSRQ